MILPQITQITQRNAASCIISQRKTGWDGDEVLWFVCVNQRDQREILEFLCAYRLSTFACYSPADPADVGIFINL